jgi:dTMP kinase
MIGMMRAGKRGAFDRFETEKLHFFEEVRQAYLQRAERFQQRIKLIQADRPLQEVQSSLIEILNDVVRDSSVVLDAGLV